MSFTQQNACSVPPCLLLACCLNSFYCCIIVHYIAIPWLICLFTYQRVSWLLPNSLAYFSIYFSFFFFFVSFYQLSQCYNSFYQHFTGIGMTHLAKDTYNILNVVSQYCKQLRGIHLSPNCLCIITFSSQHLNL